MIVTIEIIHEPKIKHIKSTTSVKGSYDPIIISAMKKALISALNQVEKVSKDRCVGFA